MNCFKRKIMLITAAAAAVFISGGCATGVQVEHMKALAEYYKAEGTKASAAASVESVKLQMRGEARKAAYARLDSEAAERVLIAESHDEAIASVVAKGSAKALDVGASSSPPTAPESGWQIAGKLAFGLFHELRDTVSAVAPIYLGVRQSRDQRDVNMHRDDALVSIENVRQTGESSRIQSVTQIARDAVTLRPSTTINVGRDATIGGGSQSNNNSSTSTDRHDNHQCQGGSPASGGAGGVGGAAAPGGPGAPSGSGQGGTC